MQLIPISCSKLFAVVDDEDYDRLSVYLWRIGGTGKGRIYRAFRENGKNKTISLACEVMKDNTTPYDHRNRNPLDNQKNNLRPATMSQNQMNREKIKGTSSIYKGVSYRSDMGKYRVIIIINGKRMHLGYFEDEVLAAKRYNEEAIKLFGEFACLNEFPSSEGIVNINTNNG